MVDLFAWAIPSPFDDSPVDHTWVTTYDSGQVRYDDLAAVAAAREDFWTCWGVFHATGRPLIQTSGDVVRARCHAMSNLPAPDRRSRGTIWTYGMQGVCHQVTNQVLAVSAPAVTCKGARGYRASTFFYSVYGLDKDGWRDRRSRCAGSAAGRPAPGAVLGLQTMGGFPVDEADEFDEHAAEVLRDRPDLFEKLKSLRLESQFALTRLARSGATAAALNESNQRYLDRAAELLGAEYFERIFEHPPGERINLVDPRFYGI